MPFFPSDRAASPLPLHLRVEHTAAWSQNRYHLPLSPSKNVAPPWQPSPRPYQHILFPSRLCPFSPPPQLTPIPTPPSTISPKFPKRLRKKVIIPNSVC